MENEDYFGFDEDEIDEEEALEESPPIENFRVVYQNNSYFLPQLNSILSDREVINIRPEYQRRLRWSNKKKSALIESLILNIPVPPVYFYENDLARYEVMDGQQRLNSIKEFYNNEFALTGLRRLSNINGKRFHELESQHRKTLDRASISAIVLLAESSRNEQESVEIRKEVFERLNTGGQRLNPQEVRNAIYRGPFNDLVVDLSREPIFTLAWSIPPYTETDQSDYYDNDKRQKNTLYKSMGDCQIILRYFAFKDESNIKGSVASILDKFAQLGTSFKSEKIPELKHEYMDILSICTKLRGDCPFRLSGNGNTREKDSIPFCDALMVAVHRTIHLRDSMVQSKKQINDSILELANTEEGFDLLVGRANTAGTIRERIDTVEQIIRDHAS